MRKLIGKLSGKLGLYGVHRRLVNIVKSFYNGSDEDVRVSGGMGEGFEINKGVR